jgi:hypothetical protein
MQPGIFPVFEAAVAVISGAAKMDDFAVVLKEADVAPGKEVPALCAIAHLIQGPPLLEGIVSLEESEFTPQCGEQGVQGL